MGLAAKIAWFVAFVIAFLATSSIVYKLQMRLQRDMLAGKGFWATQLSLLAGNLSFFLFLWLLSGFLNWTMIGLVVLISQMTPVLTTILWMFLGSFKARWGPRLSWAIVDFARSHALFFVSFAVLLPTLLAIAYLIAVGWAWFHYPYPSSELTLAVFQYTLIWTFSAYLCLQIALVGILGSEDLDEETRTRVFINQAGGLMNTALFLALALWAFGVAGPGIGPGVELPGSEIQLTLSSQLLAVLLALFVAFILVPYILGTQRARTRRQYLWQQQIDLLKEVLDILRFASSANLVAQLERVHVKLNKEMEDLHAEEPLFLYDSKISEGMTSEEMKALGGNYGLDEEKIGDLVVAYRESRQLDARVHYLHWLHKVDEKVQEIMADWRGAKTEADKDHTAQRGADSFGKEQDDLKEGLVSHRGKNLIVAGLGSLVYLFFSPMVDEAAKWAWQILHQSIAQ